MVEVAPLPAGFPPPAEAAPAAPLPATAHPLEVWAGPSPTVEPIISRSHPGGGYLSTTRTALDRMTAEHEHLRSMPRVKHQSEIDAERREREAAAEAARKISDPRATLRMAHKLHAEAAAEVERLAQPLARARDLVRDIESRNRQYDADTEAAHEAAAAALIEALAGDGTARVAAPLDARVAEEHAAVLRTAQTALDRLEAEHAAAADLLERRRHGISRCAVQVLIDQAADLAVEIEAEHEALDRRRADLDALAGMLTNEHRRLSRVPLSLPNAISRAIYPAAAARSLPSTNWASRFRTLCAAPTGSLSDTAEAGSQGYCGLGPPPC